MTASDASNQHDTGISLLGGGGHALVVADSACLAGRQIAGFFDDADDSAISTARLSGGSAPTKLGDLESLTARSLVSKPWIVCLGDLHLRRALIDRLYAAEEDAARVIHPSAIVSPQALVAGGVFAGPGSIINASARVLDHAIINSGAIIEHDCLIAENAHIAPGAVLGGNVSIGNDTLVGLGARVLPGVKIGRGCVVGAGAVVTKDIPDGETVVGCPAK